jgi:hypothetical protein
MLGVPAIPKFRSTVRPLRDSAKAALEGELTFHKAPAAYPTGALSRAPLHPASMSGLEHPRQSHIVPQLNRSASGRVQARKPVASPHPSSLKELLVRLFIKQSRRENRSWVQGELALDQVKVLRNDLSESDLEIVVTQEATPPAPRAEATLRRRTYSALHWARLTLRIFETGRTQIQG